MADALVERRPPARFFCHRCNVEFEDVRQDYTCPHCASGFIEQLENEAEGPASGDDFSDADMSNLDEMSNLEDSDDMHQSTPPVLNDLAFLMSGGRLRGAGPRETLMEQLVWMIGAARGAAGTAGAALPGAPFVLVGTPGDYVFGGEGLDAVVTQLLGQLENAGPPPLSREHIAAIPNEVVTAEQAANNTSCSVCWDAFTEGETISRLECGHIFHSHCIQPWLQLHATCPICRRSLIPTEAPPPAAEAPPTPSESTSAPRSESSTTSVGRVVMARRRRRSSSSGSSGSSAAVAPRSSSSSTQSSSSLASALGSAIGSALGSPHGSAHGSARSSDHDPALLASYNMDIDFD